MILKKLLTAGALVAAIMAPTLASAQSVPLDRSFYSIKIPWQNSGETVLVFKVTNMGGKVGVCGAYISAGGSVAATEKHMLNALYIKMGRTTVMNTLRHLNKVSASTPANQIKAKCRASRKAWKASYAKTKPELKSNQTTFEY